MTAIIEVLMEVGSLGYVWSEKSCGWSQTRRRVIRGSAERRVRGGGRGVIAHGVIAALKGARGSASSTGIC